MNNMIKKLILINQSLLFISYIFNYVISKLNNNNTINIFYYLIIFLSSMSINLLLYYKINNDIFIKILQSFIFINIINLTKQTFTYIFLKKKNI